MSATSLQPRPGRIESAPEMLPGHPPEVRRVFSRGRRKSRSRAVMIVVLRALPRTQCLRVR
jgi:hypothetical protein